MTYNLYETEDLSFALPLTNLARHQAEQFAHQQPTPAKAEQVRLNTLAVYVVNDYLQMMGIPTDLAGGDSWNPITRMCADVADLTLTGVGRIECRPLKANRSTCPIPPEVWSDRIGYVIVEIDESSLEGIVLGFTPTVAREELPLRELRPIEELITHYHQLKQPLAAAASAVLERAKVNLSQWFQETFETGWQTVESLLNPPSDDLAFSFRGGESATLFEQEPGIATVRRARQIDLDSQLDSNPVVLVVELSPASQQSTNILLQLHPTGGQTYLPSLLKLTVLDSSGAVFLEAQARDNDNYIQLQLRGLAGEEFSIEVTLCDTKVTEHFMV
ncbi:MAG: DUF1822 family protein [Coleofasciculaceae cyanobacterium]